MGDRETFEHHAERVLQYFVNKVKVDPDAKDLAQETFTRYFARSRKVEVKHPRAFLFGVANLVLKEYWKTKAGRPEGFDPGSESIIEMGAAKTTLSSLLVRHEGHLRVLDSMRHLRLDYQNVLELRFWHGLKYADIAEILKENERTVGVWLRRAKKDLARVLGELLEGSGEADGESPAFSPKSLEQWLRDSGELVREATQDSDPDSDPDT